MPRREGGAARQIPENERPQRKPLETTGKMRREDLLPPEHMEDTAEEIKARQEEAEMLREIRAKIKGPSVPEERKRAEGTLGLLGMEDVEEEPRTVRRPHSKSEAAPTTVREHARSIRDEEEPKTKREAPWTEKAAGVKERLGSASLRKQEEKGPAKLSEQEQKRIDRQRVEQGIEEERASMTKEERAARTSEQLQTMQQAEKEGRSAYRKQHMKLPPELIVRGQAKGLETQAARQRKQESEMSAARILERARQNVPHADQIWDMVQERIKEQKGGSVIRATDYVQNLAVYREALSTGDDLMRKRSLEQLYRLNNILGIEWDKALTQSVLAEEDLPYGSDKDRKAAREQFRENITRTFRKYEKELSGMNVTKAQGILKHPDQLWEAANVQLKHLGLDHMKGTPATQLVFATAAFNETARKLDNARIPKVRETVMNMAGALGLENHPSFRSELMTYDETLDAKKNPFE